MEDDPNPDRTYVGRLAAFHVSCAHAPRILIHEALSSPSSIIFYISDSRTLAVVLESPSRDSFARKRGLLAHDSMGNATRTVSR